jgi:hypothetical protein
MTSSPRVKGEVKVEDTLMKEKKRKEGKNTLKLFIEL